jgi:hypothetical protein
MTPPPTSSSPSSCGRPSSPCYPPHHPATAAAPASTTAPRWSASSTSCAPASPGSSFRPSSLVGQPGHLLAAPARLAARRRLAAPPPPAAGGAEPSGPAGLVARQPRQYERAGQAGGCLTGPNPTDRGKLGSKYHLLVDRGGIPLAVALSAANTHDSMLLEQVIDAVPAVKGPRRRPGRPRKRPRQAVPGQGLRLPPLPAGTARSRDHAPDRPAWHRAT